jgi:aminoglycoside 3-N-acetyltransferase
MTTGKLVTAARIVTDLRALGVEPGSVLMVHTSMSQIGFVPGGAQAVIEALLEALGPAGTLVMPAFNPTITDPRFWTNPGVPESWWPTIREHTPAFDPARTPTRMIGAVAELFRTWPGVRRSAHPHNSVAAVGPQSAALTGVHPLEHGMGDDSPLACLYDLDARVLLLGVDHGNNSSLHLAEHRADYPGKRNILEGAPIEGGWVEFETLYYDEADFAEVGLAFGDRATHGPVGSANAQLMSQRAIVDFGATWMTSHRGRSDPQ